MIVVSFTNASSQDPETGFINPATIVNIRPNKQAQGSRVNLIQVGTVYTYETPTELAGLIEQHEAARSAYYHDYLNG